MICMGSSVLSRFAEAEALDNGDPGARFQTLPRTSLRCGRGDTQPQVAIPASAASPHVALPRVAVMAHDRGWSPTRVLAGPGERASSPRPTLSQSAGRSYRRTLGSHVAGSVGGAMSRHPLSQVCLRADAPRAGARCAARHAGPTSLPGPEFNSRAVSAPRAARGFSEGRHSDRSKGGNPHPGLTPA
jgi:hypothetical protein